MTRHAGHPRTRADRRDRAAELVSRALDRVERRASGPVDYITPTGRRMVSQAFALAANLRAIAADAGTRWTVAP